MNDPTPYDRRSPMEHDRDDATPLRKLIEAVEAGDSFGIIPLGQKALAPHDYSYMQGDLVCNAFNGSLDAAKAMHEALLPGWCVSDLSQNGMRAGNPWGCVIEDWDIAAAESRVKRRYFSGYDHDTPARAWLLAILRAYEAQR